MKKMIVSIGVLFLMMALGLSPAAHVAASAFLQSTPNGGDPVQVFLPIVINGQGDADPGPTQTPTVTSTAPSDETPAPTSTPTSTATSTPTPTPTVTVAANADLAVVMDGPDGGVYAGQLLVYTLTLTNNGPSGAVDVVLTETLSAKVNFISAVVSVGAYDQATHLWSIPSLASAGSATLTLTTQVKASQSGSVTNQASVASATGDSNMANNSDDWSNAITSSSGLIRSDDFNYPGWKSSIWSAVDPVGDVDIFSDGSHARIRIPAGAPHVVWGDGDNNSSRILQTISNPATFSFEAKFESRPSGTYAGHGVMVEHDNNDFIRFEIFSYGANSIYIYAATITGGVVDVQLNANASATFTGNLSYFRVSRNGSVYTLSYSGNGVDWLDGPSLNFAPSVTRVGVYAGTSSSNPAYTAALDYFFNTDAPIIPEDPIDPSFIYSDDFTGDYNHDLWTKMTPYPGENFLGFTGTNALMYVGTGVEHDIWDQSEVDVTKAVKPVGLVQSMNNRSFQIEAKYDSMPTGTYTAQGLLVMNSDRINLLQYYFYSWETQLRLYASLVVDGVEQPYLVDINVPPANISAAPMLLRITRNGNSWTLEYGNGTNWFVADTFTSSFAANEVAVIVGNEDHAGDLNIPGFTGSIDYFQNNAMPITTHD